MFDETYSVDTEDPTLRKDWTESQYFTGSAYPQEAVHSFETRIIVAGSRKYDDYRQFCAIMDKCLTMHTESVIMITGKAHSGADKLIIDYCKERKIPWVEYPANWDSDGKSAGYIRNRAMSQVATDLISFWDGKSPGTKDMITVAKEKGLHVRTILVNLS